MSLTGAAIGANPDANGHKTVLVVLLEWEGETPGVTQEGARDTIFGSDPRSFASWYSTASNGRLTWGGTVTPVLDISNPGKCNTSAIESKGNIAAKAAGYNIESFDHIMYDTPDNGCDWAGMGSQGGSSIWLNDALVPLIDGPPEVAIHEMGHNLGLLHSHALKCGDVALSLDCLARGWDAVFDYGNPYDVMGLNRNAFRYGEVSLFNAIQMNLLGWSATKPQTIKTSGNYDLGALENPLTTLPQAINIDSGGREYTLEYRHAEGIDSWMAQSPQPQVVLVNLRNDGIKDPLGSVDTGPLFLDLTPGSIPPHGGDSMVDGGLAPGMQYTDAISGAFSIRVLSADNSAAHLTIVVQPTFSFSKKTYTAYQSTGKAVLTINRSDAAAAASVDIKTVSSSDTDYCRTAKVGKDYRAVSTSVSFPAGATSQNVAIPVVKTTKPNGNAACFAVVLSSPSSGSDIGIPNQASVKISYNKAPKKPGFAFTKTRYLASRFATVVIARYGPHASAASVRLKTQNGSARAGHAYRRLQTVLRFRPGQSRKSVRIRIFAKARGSFKVVLFSPVGSTLSSPYRAGITIR